MQRPILTKCSCPLVGYEDPFFDNYYINLSHVASISWNKYPEMQSKSYNIYFNIINSHGQTWRFAKMEDRDSELQRLCSIMQ